VEKIVGVDARSSSSKIPGPAGLGIQELLLRLVFRYLVTDSSIAWINDHRIRCVDPLDHHLPTDVTAR